MKKTSEIYKVAEIKRNKARAGETRPTICQLFTSGRKCTCCDNVISTYAESDRSTQVVPMTTALLVPEIGTSRLNVTPGFVGTADNWWLWSGLNGYYISSDTMITSTVGASLKFNISGTDLLRMCATRDSESNCGGSGEVYIDGELNLTYTVPIQSDLTVALVVFQILNLNPEIEHSVEIKIINITGTKGATVDVLDLDSDGSFLPYSLKEYN